MPSRWDWRCGRIYDLILHMGKTMNKKICKTAGGFMQRKGFTV
jgi:hypothetical protein